MKSLTLAAALLAAVPLGIGAAHAANANWNTTYAETEAGHRMGNPEAETHLVAFVSYTCPHCARFEREADGPLRIGYIHSGELSLEVRPFIRNPVDLAASLAAQCGPEDRFFGNHRAIMFSHDDWMQTVRQASQAQQARWVSGTVGERMRAIASDLDFYDLLEQRGYSVAELDRCLSDEAAARRLAETSQAQGAEFSIPGTPSFVVNGELLDGVHTWDALKSALGPMPALATPEGS